MDPLERSDACPYVCAGGCRASSAAKDKWSGDVRNSVDCVASVEDTDPSPASDALRFLLAPNTAGEGRRSDIGQSLWFPPPLLLALTVQLLLLPLLLLSLCRSCLGSFVDGDGVGLDGRTENSTSTAGDKTARRIITTNHDGVCS